MIEWIPPGATHVVAFRANGKVDAKDLQTIIDAIEATKRDHPRISLYAEFDDMRWITGTALLRDIGYGLTQIGELSRYYRAAVVSDKRWITRIARLEGRLFKSVEIRTFATAQRDTAREWVRHLPEAPEPAMANAAVG